MAVDAADVKSRFPEFADVDDDVVTAAIAEAQRNVDDTWLEDDRDPAVTFLTAHKLTIGGLGTNAGNAGSGVVVSEKLGDASVTYAQGGDARSSEIRSTYYGREYDRLLRLNHPGILTV